MAELAKALVLKTSILRDVRDRDSLPPPNLRRCVIIGSRPDWKSGALSRGLGVQVPPSPPNLT